MKNIFFPMSPNQFIAASVTAILPFLRYIKIHAQKCLNYFLKLLNAQSLSLSDSVSFLLFCEFLNMQYFL